MPDPIYLDYNATTDVAPEVIDAMTHALREDFGNPSSAHAYGHRAKECLDRSREEVARLLGARADEILFTSGGTESDNLAILGRARLDPRGRHVVTTTIEHPAVSLTCEALEKEGFEITWVGVDRQGQVQADDVLAAMRDDTTLVTIMHANNETGALQPIEAIGRHCRERQIPFHTDAAQSVGKLPIDVSSLGVDLLTVAGHKLYAPKGVGVLYVRRGMDLSPITYGGGHERGLRPGTENIASTVALGCACRLASEERETRPLHLRTLRDRLYRSLEEKIGEVELNGPREERLPNTLNISIPGIEDANRLLRDLPELATSTGSACHAGESAPSPVLLAMGHDPKRAITALRLSVGRPTTEDEIDRAAELLEGAITKARG